MKKMLGIVFASFLALGAVGCGKDKEDEQAQQDKKNAEEFGKYLSDNSYSVSQLDSDLSALVDLDESLELSDLAFTNTKVKMSTNISDVEDGEIYMWQETENSDKYVYVAGPLSDTGEDVAYRVNLTDLQGKLDDIAYDYSGFVEDLNEDGKVVASEMIDSALDLNGVDTSVINAENILERFKFDIDDFKNKGNGVFILKNSSIIEIAEGILDDLLGEDDYYSQEDIDEMNDLVKIQFNFKDNLMKKIVISLNNSYDLSDDEYVDRYNSNAIITLNYDSEGKKVESIRYKGIVNTSKGYNNYVVNDSQSFDMSLSNNSATLTFIDGSDEFDFSISENNGKTIISIKVEGKEVASIEFDIGIIGNWISEATFSVTYSDEYEDVDLQGKNVECEIISNVEVSVPNSLKSLDAIDMTEDFMDMIDTYINEMEEELEI